jgi:outer membrane protein
VCTPAHLPRSYSGVIAEASPEIEGKHPYSSDEALRKLEKDGNINLSLSDCLKIALQHNYDIRLTREALIQADTKITQARSAMLPFLGVEASYARLDEELNITMGPQSLTFMVVINIKQGSSSGSPFSREGD